MEVPFFYFGKRLVMQALEIGCISEILLLQSSEIYSWPAHKVNYQISMVLLYKHSLAFHLFDRDKEAWKHPYIKIIFSLHTEK